MYQNHNFNHCRTDAQFLSRFDSIEMPELTIITDGSCVKNPGGLGSIAYRIYNSQDTVKPNPPCLFNECRSFIPTTNNRMEILAILCGLTYASESMNKKHVEVVSDSQFALKLFSEWAVRWEREGRIDQQKNPDLTRLILKYITAFDRIVYTWVKGHAGIVLNELADEDAERALHSPPVKDIGYTHHPAQTTAGNRTGNLLSGGK